MSFDATSAIMYVRVRTLDGASVIDTRESVRLGDLIASRSTLSQFPLC